MSEERISDEDLANAIGWFESERSRYVVANVDVVKALRELQRRRAVEPPPSPASEVREMMEKAWQLSENLDSASWSESPNQQLLAKASKAIDDLTDALAHLQRDRAAVVEAIQGAIDFYNTEGQGEDDPTWVKTLRALPPPTKEKGE